MVYFTRSSPTGSFFSQQESNDMLEGGGTIWGQLTYHSANLTWLYLQLIYFKSTVRQSSSCQP